MSRHIAFEAIDNFRDYGDYAAGARRLKPGLLYRSANMSRATDADLEKLQSLGVRVIVDLRRPAEREKQPNRRHADFAGSVIENDITGAAEDDLRAFLKEAGDSADNVRQYMLAYYREAPFQPRHLDLYQRYFQALAETDGPLLVHCAAGKDRTGIICALTQHLAGVHDDDIVADYLLTNDEARITRRLPMMSRYVQEATGVTPDEAALRVAMSCEASYLEAAFQAMRERHGSLDGYLDEALGLNAASRQRLHDRLLG